ncbi:MAG: hypothetical protein ABSH41_05650 [Syntrophobacteraceae bacterium]
MNGDGIIRDASGATAAEPSRAGGVTKKATPLRIELPNSIGSFAMMLCMAGYFLAGKLTSSLLVVSAT